MFITRKIIKDNPHTLFIFGDNDKRKGYGGMAKEFRNEPNSMGVRTKKAPNMGAAAFYIDDEFEDNVKKIDEDIEEILHLMNRFKHLVIPDGVGKGLAKLQENAPRTFNYLQEHLNRLRKKFI